MEPTDLYQTPESLRALGRSKLQSLARREKIKANAKTEEIVRQLLERHPGGVRLLASVSGAIDTVEVKRELVDAYPDAPLSKGSRPDSLQSHDDSEHTEVVDLLLSSPVSGTSSKKRQRSHAVSGLEELDDGYPDAPSSETSSRKRRKSQRDISNDQSGSAARTSSKKRQRSHDGAGSVSDGHSDLPTPDDPILKRRSTQDVPDEGSMSDTSSKKRRRRQNEPEPVSVKRVKATAECGETDDSTPQPTIEAWRDAVNEKTVEADENHRTDKTIPSAETAVPLPGPKHVRYILRSLVPSVNEEPRLVAQLAHLDAGVKLVKKMLDKQERQVRKSMSVRRFVEKLV